MIILYIAAQFGSDLVRILPVRAKQYPIITISLYIFAI